MFARLNGENSPPELVFWNQDSHKLMLAPIPADRRNSGPWPATEIYFYSVQSEPLQRGKAAPFKGVNEHEGVAITDVDGDGKPDIVGGGNGSETWVTIGSNHTNSIQVTPLPVPPRADSSRARWPRSFW